MDDEKDFLQQNFIWLAMSEKVIKKSTNKEEKIWEENHPPSKENEDDIHWSHSCIFWWFNYESMLPFPQQNFQTECYIRWHSTEKIWLNLEPNTSLDHRSQYLVKSSQKLAFFILNFGLYNIQKFNSITGQICPMWRSPIIKIILFCVWLND